jgi:hypothetical protein
MSKATGHHTLKCEAAKSNETLHERYTVQGTKMKRHGKTTDTKRGKIVENRLKIKIQIRSIGFMDRGGVFQIGLMHQQYILHRCVTTDRRIINDPVLYE